MKKLGKLWLAQQIGPDLSRSATIKKKYAEIQPQEIFRVK